MNGIVQRYWVQKYGRPANDPLWTDQSFPEHLTEFFADRWRDYDDVKRALDNPDLDLAQVAKLQDQLKALEGVLEIVHSYDDTTSHGDPLEDYWMWQEAQGEEPDLDMTMERLREMGWSR